MVSGFKGKGKRTFFQVWNNFSDATDAFVLLSNCPTKQALENTFATVQKFTVLAYDKSSSEAKVDKLRKTQFTQKNKAYDAIPPTEDSLKQHCLRAPYQAGYVLGQALKPYVDLPSRNEWGWKKDLTAPGTFIGMKIPIAETCK